MNNHIFVHQNSIDVYNTSDQIRKSLLHMNISESFITNMLNHFQEMAHDTYERRCDAETDLPQQEAINTLSKGIWYSYDYYKALKKFNQKQRSRWLVSSGASFHGYLPSTFFRPVESTILPTGRELARFKIAKNVSPSKALDCFKNSLCFLGCEEVRDVAVWKALKDALGEKKFDHLFSDSSPFPLEIGGGSQNPISRLFNTIRIQSNECIQPGDFCHFSNIQGYIPKHPAGSARGFNVICYHSSSEGKNYLGHGLNPEGVSEEGIERILWENYNADPAEEGFLAPNIWKFHFTKSLLLNEQASRSFVDSHKNSKLSWEQFQQTPSRLAFKEIASKGKLKLTIDRLDLSRIELLVKTPLENLQKVFGKMKARLV